MAIRSASKIPFAISGSTDKLTKQQERQRVFDLEPVDLDLALLVDAHQLLDLLL